MPKKAAPPIQPQPEPKPARTMSAEHKAALAAGREEGRVVRRYLEALEAHRPKRGRKRTAEGIARRLATVEEQLATADPLSRLHLVQERMDLQRQLEAGGEQTDLPALEADFVGVAAAYGRRKGIAYDAWREAGVEPRVLRAAGVGRSQ